MFVAIPHYYEGLVQTQQRRGTLKLLGSIIAHVSFFSHVPEPLDCVVAH